VLRPEAFQLGLHVLIGHRIPTIRLCHGHRVLIAAVDLVLGTLLLRPYVFGFLAVYLLAAALDLGLRRVVLFTACVGSVALVAELSSTRTGIPFGFYTYTQSTRGQELFIADVPFMDPLSFTF